MPNVKVYMGVGATIDYEAGAVVRAPRWMTRNGLEWVYRITTEPKRYWRRYLRDLEYFWLCSSTGSACIARRPRKERRMIRTAMVGLGKMGLSHLAIARAPSRRSSSWPAATQTAYLTDVLTKYTGLKCYDDFDRMLQTRAARRRWSIATPSKLHASMVREGARARPARLLREALRARRRRRRAAGRAGREQGARQPGRLPLPLRRRVQGGGAHRAVGRARHGPSRSRRGLRSGRAAPQGRHLALGQERGRRRAVRLRLPCDRPGQLHRRHADVGERRGASTASSRATSTTRSTARCTFADGASGQLCVNWSDESFRKMSTKISVWGTNGRITADRQECQIYLREPHAAAARRRAAAGRSATRPT